MSASYNVQIPQVQGLTQQQQRAGFNQLMAQAHASADPRFNVKPLDRAGMSRGGGQQHLAGISAAQNLAKGIADAYGQQASDAVANANIGTRSAAEALGLGMNAIGQQQQYADALAALQRQQQSYGFTQNLLGGLLGGMDNFLGF